MIFRRLKVIILDGWRVMAASVVELESNQSWNLINRMIIVSQGVQFQGVKEERVSYFRHLLQNETVS